MDTSGWQAKTRAGRENEYVPHRGADGNFLPVEATPMPIDESFIGGFRPYLLHSNSGPPLPPKDDIYRQPGYRFGQTTKSSISSSQFTTMSAVERSHAQRIPRTDPQLQFMVGPLLRYDTVEDGVWRGAVLIVTADSGSIYEPHPMLSFEWDPDIETKAPRNQTRASYDLGPHPADPSSTTLNGTHIFTNQGDSSAARGPNFRNEQVPAHEIWVYAGTSRTSTFWRFPIEIPLGPNEMAITYTINGGQPFVFYVPGLKQNMRWATYSCNGFSAGVNPDDFRGPGFNSGYDPVWVDLLSKHAEQPFHALVGGGDQIYCDAITREPELQDWINSKPHERKQYQLTDEISSTIDRFYFNHYCTQWRSGAFARANSTIPMMNMAGSYQFAVCIDGFGSYPDDLQMAPVFRHDAQTVDLDGVDDRPGKHFNRSVIIGSAGPYVSFPSHSFLGYMGPHTYILLLDCRAERRKDQVCSPAEYQKVFDRLSKLPSSVEHLCVQVGIPIAYPRLVFLEKALESKYNPLVALGKAGSMGLSSFVNKFNAEAELLDDLNDHWTSRSHKKERNWFVEQLQKFAKARQIRITFLSGDVHCAAVGYFKTLKAQKSVGIPPPNDHRYMLNIVTSAIVNTPPPDGVISLVSSLASNRHRTMHYAQTDESMVPIFKTETNGKPRKQPYVMGRRNWCQVKWENRDWVFEIRVEKEKGAGHTVGYSIRSPPPEWETS
ncbi:hypothetical protein GGX14DRAFT_434737 [Mycena pura]|uniref:PhoD-like phosphatase domain-containing protein n=1 Tax=Mycena pura TaxID=153505 RepID=A0AAD6YFR5_9AGAR|nr:hypothetical protein GGX14DRAFT_434737 [Mycena pura]